MKARNFLVVFGLFLSAAAMGQGSLIQSHVAGAGMGYSNVDLSEESGAKFGDVYAFYSYRPDNSLNLFLNGTSSVFGSLTGDLAKNSKEIDVGLVNLMATAGYRFTGISALPALAVTPLAGAGYESLTFPLRKKESFSHIPLILGAQVDYRFFSRLEAGLQARYHYYTSGEAKSEAKNTAELHDLKLAGSSGYFAFEVPVIFQINKNLLANASYNFTTLPRQVSKNVKVDSSDDVENNKRHALKAGLGYTF